MFDIALRPLKDRVVDPLCHHIPTSITPATVTLLGFSSGLISCLCISQQRTSLSLSFWILNRVLDCLDGALARHRNTTSDLGGFFDLLCDFIIYSLLPILTAFGHDNSSRCWMAIAILEATFHINNFILFYVAAVAEKTTQKAAKSSRAKELTSVMMRPALVEGMESGILFTAMLALPHYIEILSTIMAGLVGIGIVQRIIWTLKALG